MIGSKLHATAFTIDEIPVQIRRVSRARRMTLRISSIDKKVQLSIPPHTKLRVAENFIIEKSEWIKSKVKELPDKRSVRTTSSLPLLGRMMPVEPYDGKSAKLSSCGQKICVPQAPETRNRAILAFYKLRARDALAHASDYFCTQIGASYQSLKIRDTRSRWGSCSAEGGLMYSWRLVLAPTEVLNYVAAHEVCHLVHMNHSDEFWDLVATICPAFRTHKRWLKENGSSLHQWSFDD